MYLCNISFFIMVMQRLKVQSLIVRCHCNRYPHVAWKRPLSAMCTFIFKAVKRCMDYYEIVSVCKGEIKSSNQGGKERKEEVKDFSAGRVAS